MHSINYLIIPLWEGYEWFDEGLQKSLKALGWPTMTGPESMIIVHVILGINRPSEIARSLGLTRQAVHFTINKIIKKGIVELHSDPLDARSSVVGFTKIGKTMRRDARMIVAHIEQVLIERIGAKNVQNLKAALAPDWGPPVIYAPAQSQASGTAPKKKKRKAR